VPSLARTVSYVVPNSASFDSNRWPRIAGLRQPSSNYLTPLYTHMWLAVQYDIAAAKSLSRVELYIATVVGGGVREFDSGFEHLRSTRGPLVKMGSRLAGTGFCPRHAMKSRSSGLTMSM
jgi:hypothetical protein